MRKATTHCLVSEKQEDDSPEVDDAWPTVRPTDRPAGWPNKQTNEGTNERDDSCFGRLQRSARLMPDYLTPIRGPKRKAFRRLRVTVTEAISQLNFRRVLCDASTL